MNKKDLLQEKQVKYKLPDGEEVIIDEYVELYDKDNPSWLRLHWKFRYKGNLYGANITIDNKEKLNTKDKKTIKIILKEFFDIMTQNAIDTLKTLYKTI